MFSALTGMPISEYVRRRWMTRAADDLVAGDDDLLSVAVRHGYSSTESFGRAFRAVHGARPTDVRRAGGPVRAQLPLRFHLTVEGSTPMDVRVLDLPAFRLIGPSARVPLVHAGANPHIAAFLRGLPPGTTDALAAFAAASADPATRPSGVVAVSDGLDPDRAEGTELTYQHAVAVPAGATPAVPGLPEGVAVATTEVAAGTWAVFASSGPFPAALQDTWARTATEWFPSQPYRLRPGPELLTVTVHPPAAGTPATSGPTADAEIWLPVAR
ncbi:AraC family transcriptional regulator [Nocardioides sp. ChNu-99]|nr:AraC family transcriptional regulator [Nocardioides sp. ChNu-99]